MYVLIKGEVGIAFLKEKNIFAQQHQEQVQPPPAKLNQTSKKKTLQSVHIQLEDNPCLFYNIGEIQARLKDGFAFGDAAIQEEKGHRNASLLVIYRQDFMKIQDIVDETKKQKTNFMTVHVPGIALINNRELLDQIVYLFNEQKFLKGEYITREGEVGKNIYILIAGCLKVQCFVEIEKKKLQVSQKPQYIKLALNLSEIDSNQIIGEEILRQTVDCPYKFSVQVVSGNAKLYQISKKEFLSQLPRDCLNGTMQIFNGQEQFYESQKEHYQDNLKDSVEKNSIKYNYNPLHIEFSQKFQNTAVSQIFGTSLVETERFQLKEAPQEQENLPIIYQKNHILQLRREKTVQKLKIKFSPLSQKDIVAHLLESATTPPAATRNGGINFGMTFKQDRPPSIQQNNNSHNIDTHDNLLKRTEISPSSHYVTQRSPEKSPNYFDLKHPIQIAENRIKSSRQESTKDGLKFLPIPEEKVENQGNEIKNTNAYSFQSNSHHQNRNLQFDEFPKLPSMSGNAEYFEKADQYSKLQSEADLNNSITDKIQTQNLLSKKQQKLSFLSERNSQIPSLVDISTSNIISKQLSPSVAKDNLKSKSITDLAPFSARNSSSFCLKETWDFGIQDFHAKDIRIQVDLVKKGLLKTNQHSDYHRQNGGVGAAVTQNAELLNIIKQHSLNVRSQNNLLQSVSISNQIKNPNDFESFNKTKHYQLEGFHQINDDFSKFQIDFFKSNNNNHHSISQINNVYNNNNNSNSINNSNISPSSSSVGLSKLDEFVKKGQSQHQLELEYLTQEQKKVYQNLKLQLEL